MLIGREKRRRKLESVTVFPSDNRRIKQLSPKFSKQKQKETEQHVTFILADFPQKMRLFKKQ